MTLIDGEKLIEILRNSHESHAQNSRERALLERDIRLVKEQMKYDPVIPEEMKQLIEQTTKVIPQLVDAVVENLPRIIDDMDLCADCEYRKVGSKKQS